VRLTQHARRILERRATRRRRHPARIIGELRIGSRRVGRSRALPVIIVRSLARRQSRTGSFHLDTARSTEGPDGRAEARCRCGVQRWMDGGRRGQHRTEALHRGALSSRRGCQRTPTLRGRSVAQTSNDAPLRVAAASRSMPGDGAVVGGGPVPNSNFACPRRR
jgi:hypothetical protein